MASLSTLEIHTMTSHSEGCIGFIYWLQRSFMPRQELSPGLMTLATFEEWCRPHIRTATYPRPKAVAL